MQLSRLPNLSLRSSFKRHATRQQLVSSVLPGCCCRAAAVTVRCQARVKSPRTATGSQKKGFGKSKAPKKPQEPWEAELLPAYKVYYKQGFKPTRFQGPIRLKTFEDGSVGVVTSEEAHCAELLAVSQPVAFLDGSLGSAPAVEDLHVALLEVQLAPCIHKVYSHLPRTPTAAARAAAAAAREAAAAATAAGAEQQPAATAGTGAGVESLEEPSPQTIAAAAGEAADPASPQQEQPSTDSSSSSGSSSPAEQSVAAAAAAATAAAATAAAAAALSEVDPPADLTHLLPMFWEQFGLKASDVQPLSSKQLMRMLQASSWSEEFRDPAASQVRHEKASGFIGVWPEHAMLRHSCAPNSSVCVVDRYMLLHATDNLEEGDEVTANKLGSAVAAPLAVRQATHQELFGRPCGCSRCQLEQELSPEAAAALQAVADKAQGEWQDRLQSVLEAPSTGTLTEEEAADKLTDLQGEIAEQLSALDDTLAACVADKEQRLLVTAAVYPAYDLAWQMEDLLMEEPDLDKLANCVALLRMFARGTDSHVYTALLLQQAYSDRVQQLAKQAQNMPRKTAAMQRRLTNQINQVIAGADMASAVYSEALVCRYGMIPNEGLVPQLEEGLTLFYAGLNALSAARGEGLDEVPEVTRNLTIEGIPVTVVDTVDGSLFAGPSEAAAVTGGKGSEGSRPRFTIEVVDDAAAAQEEAAAVEAIEAAVAEAVAGLQEEPQTAEPISQL